MASRIFFAFGVTLALLASRAWGAEREVTRTFPAGPGSMLKIDSHRGAIEVGSADGDEVKITVHLEIGTDNETEADDLLRRLQLVFSQHDETISVVARNPAETRWRWTWDDDKQIGLTFRVTVPRRCNLDLAVGQGSVTVAEIAGRMRARTEKGTIFFRGVEGSADAQNDSGDVVVSHCTGALHAHVRQGLIRVGAIGGPSVVENDSGNVEILLARGELTARAEAGDIAVGFPRRIEPGTRLATSGGSITVKIDPRAACDIEAASRWGRVRSALPFAVRSGAIGRARFAGRLNGGGPELVLKASGGDVNVLEAEMPAE